MESLRLQLSSISFCFNIRLKDVPQIYDFEGTKLIYISVGYKEIVTSLFYQSLKRQENGLKILCVLAYNNIGSPINE